MPGIGAAAYAMDAAVAFSNSGLSINDDIRRALNGWTSNGMDADFASVAIDTLCLVSNSRASGHDNPPLCAMDIDPWRNCRISCSERPVDQAVEKKRKV